MTSTFTYGSENTHLPTNINLDPQFNLFGSKDSSKSAAPVKPTIKVDSAAKSKDGHKASQPASKAILSQLR